MTWDEITVKYPNKWVVVKNAVLDGAVIISGDVIKVIPDKKVKKYFFKKDPDVIIRRTSEGNWDGIIDSNFKVTVH